MTDSRRSAMIERQLRRRGISDERVLAAFAEIPRENFIGEHLADRAYDDRPLPIGQEQTISQPYIVALMLEALELKPADRMLEIGFGSGYAAAIASRMVASVVAIERQPGFEKLARERFVALGIDNVELRTGDGSLGAPDTAPFDAILVSAAASSVPDALRDQLAEGGRLVMPIGGSMMQTLVRLRRASDGWKEDDLGSVRFVPLISD